MIFLSGDGVPFACQMKDLKIVCDEVWDYEARQEKGLVHVHGRANDRDGCDGGCVYAPVILLENLNKVPGRQTKLASHPQKATSVLFPCDVLVEFGLIWERAQRKSHFSQERVVELHGLVSWLEQNIISKSSRII